MSIKKNAAQTSNADRVIDALAEVRNLEKKPGYRCSSCGGTSYTPRRALGGPLIQVCLSCGNKDVKGSGRGTVFLSDENLNHSQGVGRGPTASTLQKQQEPKEDKYTPTFKTKSERRE